MGVFAISRMTVLTVLGSLLLSEPAVIASESSGRVLRQIETGNMTVLARDLLDSKIPFITMPLAFVVFVVCTCLCCHRLQNSQGTDFWGPNFAGDTFATRTRVGRSDAAIATESLRPNFGVSSIKVGFRGEGGHSNMNTLRSEPGLDATTVFQTELVDECEPTAFSASSAPTPTINPINGHGQSSVEEIPDEIPMAILVSERSLKANN